MVMGLRVRVTTEPLVVVIGVASVGVVTTGFGLPGEPTISGDLSSIICSSLLSLCVCVCVCVCASVYTYNGDSNRPRIVYNQIFISTLDRTLEIK